MSDSVCGDHGACAIRLGEDDRELFTAVSSDDIRVPNGHIQYFRELFENCVTCRVAKCIVVTLEVIYVYLKERKRGRIPMSASNFRCKPLLERAVICQSGEAILRDKLSQCGVG